MGVPVFTRDNASENGLKSAKKRWRDHVRGVLYIFDLSQDQRREIVTLADKHRAANALIGFDARRRSAETER
jgi:hypothetical protein